MHHQGDAFDGQQRLYQIVARRIARMIDEHKDDPSWTVPTERELAHLLNVSRPVIREAIIALEVSGMVTVKGRAGITVQRRPGIQRNAFSPQDANPLQLLEARLVVESNVALLACQQSSRDLAELESNVASLELAGPENFARCASDFAVITARVTGNPALVATVEAVTAAWQQSSSGLGSSLYAPTLRSRWIGDHYAMFSALKAGAGSAAYAATARHLRGLREATALTMSGGSATSPFDPAGAFTGLS